MEAGRGYYVMRGSRDEEIGHVIKGKRTKRQRLQSEEAFLEDRNNGGTNFFSTSCSLDQIQTSTDEEEEQDMAYCLILLAQGVRSHESTAPISKSPNSHIYSSTPASSPVSFRSAGKLGKSYDYECKTCGRAFHSFQALGGHRASHKKPKAISAIEDARKELQLSFEGEDEEEEEAAAEIKNRFSYPLSLSLTPRSQRGNNKSNKIHECSVCGAEFSSGQALGGHMRRHRAPLMATSPSLSLMEDLKPEELQNKRKRSGISLDLDLNLPAQPEGHNDLRESKLMSLINSNQQKKRQQQHESHHVFSPPALVDCHYYKKKFNFY